jgi:hypothetical protein
MDRDMPTKRINITRELLDSLRKAGTDGKHREIADPQKGFGVRITPSGAMSFYYRYTGADGKHRRQTIGAYPGMTVSDARRRALELMQEVEHSGDTATDLVRITPNRPRRSSRRLTASSMSTTAGVCAQASRSRSATIVELRKLGKAFPGAMNRISVQDVLGWAYSELEKEIGEDRTMTPATVRRKLISLRGLFTHAVRLGFSTANPVAQVVNDNQALFDEGEARDQWLRADMEVRLRAAIDAREPRADRRAPPMTRCMDLELPMSITSGPLCWPRSAPVCGGPNSCSCSGRISISTTSVSGYRRIQAEVKTIGELFVRTVARIGNMPAVKVRATQGATFLGARGVDASFADAVMSPDAAFSSVLQSLSETRRGPGAGSLQIVRTTSQRTAKRLWGRLTFDRELARAVR